MLKNRHRNGRYNGKQTVAVLGPGSWGTALSQVLNDNGHEVRLWGNIQEQIDEINTAHTNQRYFKDIIISDQITATTDLKALGRCGRYPLCRSYKGDPLGGETSC